MDRNTLIDRNELDVNNPEHLITGNNDSPIEGKAWSRKIVILDKCHKTFFKFKTFVCDTASKIKKTVTQICVRDAKVKLSEDIQKKLDIYCTNADDLQYLDKDLKIYLRIVSSCDCDMAQLERDYTYALDCQKEGKKLTCRLTFIVRAMDRNCVNQKGEWLKGATKSYHKAYKKCEAKKSEFRTLEKATKDSFD